MTPEKVGTPESVEVLAALKPDLFVVVAYGQYIPTTVIELAPQRSDQCPSLPASEYRGSAPIQWAIANGDKVTGVSIIYLAKKMDAGDILRQETYPIGEDDTSGILHDRLAVSVRSCCSRPSMISAAERFRVPVQDESQAVEIRKLAKEDGEIDWTLPAETIR